MISQMFCGPVSVMNVMCYSFNNKATVILILRVVSAEFQTSRSEERHKRKWHKLSLLDSYLYNLPNSAKKLIFNITRIERIEDFEQQCCGKYIRNNAVINKYFILYWFYLPSQICNKRLLDPYFIVCPLDLSSTWKNSDLTGQIFGN
jgi:hypothetical protein